MTAQLSPLARFDNLLLTTDGSEVSAGAVRVALNMASRCGGRLTVMHMARTLPEYAMFNPGGVRQAEETGGAVLSEVERQAGIECVNCVPVLRYGDEPVREIVAQAEASDADLVIMGRRGVHWLERLMLGEAAARVVGHVRCSVLVVPQASGMWEKGILLAVDGSRYADAAAVAAAVLATHCGLPVTVLSVCASDDLKCDMVQAMSDRVRDLLRLQGVTAESMIKEGNPARAIIDAATESDCDLIIVGSHGRTGLDRLMMGSVSRQVVIQAKCPVLVAKTV